MKRSEEAALRAYPISTPPSYIDGHTSLRQEAFIKGYHQAEKDLGWHYVDESLPPVDEEVIVLVDVDAGFGRIAFGHIVNPEEVVDVAGNPYKPVSHNGWNIPGVRYWMPCPQVSIMKKEEGL